MTRGHLKQPGRPAIKEADFQTAVIELARLRGWLVYHARPARTAKGWRTPVQGDGVGFPDLLLVKPGVGVFYRELKAGRGALSENQKTWIHAINAAGGDAGVWTPADWVRIAEELAG